MTTAGETHVPVPLGGPIDRDQFRVSRRLPDASAGLSVLVLDAHALGHSNDLADIRLANEGGRQVPYLIEDREEPIEIVLPIPQPRSAGASSTYRLDLPYEFWPGGTRLVLKTSGRVFDRSITIQRAAGDHRNRRAMRIHSGVWRHISPESAAPPFEAQLPVRRARAIDVVIDEGDNAPLPITSARLVLPARALRFDHPGKSLFLLYGNRRASAPRYDISLLARRLTGAPAQTITLPPPPADTGPDEESTDRRLFWIAIVTAGVVLTALLLRLVLVRPETSRAPSDTT